ncbi:hypothetical protein DY000_02039441 [Brassica cretica]|uniref:Uncharacterized protein n=1 Tax=Brassica cretica TaxID=69181 RepID=A0ABQ7BE52_BRACR|nr:hypothetical protein DY000_02039441 [Brassica cretica]
MDRRNPKLTPSLDPQVGRIVAEEELQILNKPNHVSTAEEVENQCGKSGYGQVLHEPFLKLLKHEEGDESEVSQETERLALQSITIPNQEKVPLYGKEFDYFLCYLKCDAEEFLVHGTMIFADVLGRTLSGRHLPSSRRYFRRIVWHQVRSSSLMSPPTL